MGEGEKKTGLGRTLAGNSDKLSDTGGARAEHLGPGRLEPKLRPVHALNHRFKLFGSIAMTHLLTVTCCHLLAILISYLKVSFHFLIISNISFNVL